MSGVAYFSIPLSARDDQALAEFCLAAQKGANSSNNADIRSFKVTAGRMLCVVRVTTW